MRLLLRVGGLLLIFFSLPYSVGAESDITQLSTWYPIRGFMLPWWGYVIVFILFVVHAFWLINWVKRKNRSKQLPKLERKDTPTAVRRTMFTVIPGNAQTIGSREEQQDAFGFSDIQDEQFIHEAGVLVVLADGMGGLYGGREVSHIAVQSFLEHYLHSNEITLIPEKLMSSLKTANKSVLQFTQEHSLIGNAGTTIVAAVVFEDQLYWLSVGDSRIYLNNGESLTQLNTEHKYAKELDKKVALGVLSHDEALKDPQRESLTSFLGIENLEEIDASNESIPLHKGDSIILCSDGLYGSLPEEEIREVCNYLPTQEAAEELIELVLAKKIPNQDNATVAILTIV